MFIKARLPAAPSKVIAFGKANSGLACHSSGADSALRAALFNQEDSEVRFKTHFLFLIDFWSRHWGEVQVDNWGRSPLEIAFTRNNVEIVSLLLEAGAASTKKDCYGATFLARALNEKNDKMATALLKAKDIASVINLVHSSYGFRVSPLCQAISFADPGLIAAMIVAGADVSVKSDPNLGATILMVAILQRREGVAVATRLEVILVLLRALKEAGISVDEANKEGYTALMWASDKEIYLCYLRKVLL